MWHHNLAFARANKLLFVQVSFPSFSSRTNEKQLNTRFCRRRPREIIITLVSQSTGQTESRCNRGEMQLTLQYHNPITPLPLLRAMLRNWPFL